MSWSIDVVSKDKDAIKAAIDSEKTMPEPLRALLRAHIDARDTPLQTDYGTFGLHVKSSGHVDSNSCYGDFRVELIKILP